MADFQLCLTEDQRELLAEILGSQLKEKRVQEHRADSLEFKHMIAHQEELIEGILSKLGGVPVA